ncbi:MAG: PPOX class F420-dependent oxidoreductase [Actinomycetota bacterium]
MAVTPIEIPMQYKDLLDAKGFAHIATLGPDGTPHSSPVWYDYDGRHILFSNTKARQKYRNVGRNRSVALSIIDPENPYRYIEIRGVVTEIADDPNKDFINKMAKKYTGRDTYSYDGPEVERVVIKIAPTHTTQMGA